MRLAVVVFAILCTSPAFAADDSAAELTRALNRLEELDTYRMRETASGGAVIEFLKGTGRRMLRDVKVAGFEGVEEIIIADGRAAWRVNSPALEAHLDYLKAQQRKNELLTIAGTIKTALDAIRDGGPFGVFAAAQQAMSIKGSIQEFRRKDPLESLKEWECVTDPMAGYSRPENITETETVTREGTAAVQGQETTVYRSDSTFHDRTTNRSWSMSFRTYVGADGLPRRVEALTEGQAPYVTEYFDFNAPIRFSIPTCPQAKSD